MSSCGRCESICIIHVLVCLIFFGFVYRVLFVCYYPIFKIWFAVVARRFQFHVYGIFVFFSFSVLLVFSFCRLAAAASRFSNIFILLFLFPFLFPFFFFIFDLRQPQVEQNHCRKSAKKSTCGCCKSENENKRSRKKKYLQSLVVTMWRAAARAPLRRCAPG